MKYLVKLIAVVLAVGILTNNAYGGWTGPVEVLSGTWGSAEGQFGFEEGDSVAYDMFPGPIYLLLTGDIIIRDVLNGRYKVYSSSGSIKKVLKCIKVSTDVYNEECNIDGKFLQTQSNGNLWTYTEKKYYQYSPTGTLISTSPTRPLELGQVTEKRIGKKEYQITVKFPDVSDPTKEKVLVITSDKSIGYGVARPFRDANGKLYLIYSKKVERYNDEGKIVGTLSMPEVQYGAVTIPPDWPDNAEPPRARVVAEHGSPVVAPNGDVYTWMRSDTHYKILKWTWQN